MGSSRKWLQELRLVVVAAAAALWRTRVARRMVAIFYMYPKKGGVFVLFFLKTISFLAFFLLNS